MVTSSSFLESPPPKIFLSIQTGILERLSSVSALTPHHKRIYVLIPQCGPETLTAVPIFQNDPFTLFIFTGGESLKIKTVFLRDCADFDQTQIKVKAQSPGAIPKTTDKTKYVIPLSP